MLFEGMIQIIIYWLMKEKKDSRETCLAIIWKEKCSYSFLKSA